MDKSFYGYKETTKLIQAIRKKPALYNKNHADYNNKEEREQLWTDICWDIFSNWSELSPLEREMKVKDVQKKWRNVRDSFRKELNLQKQAKIGKVRKKREYVYFRHLKFLLPLLLDQGEIKQEDFQKLNAESTMETTNFENYTTEGDESNIKFESEDTQLSNESSISIIGKGEEDSQPILEMWDNSENGYSGNINNFQFHSDIDEDRYFLLSLVPTLKTLNSQQKLSVKLQFLQVLQNVTSNNSKPIS